MIPTHAEHLAVPLGVVVIRVKARQNSLSTLTRDYEGPIDPRITGESIFSEKT